MPRPKGTTSKLVKRLEEEEDPFIQGTTKDDHADPFDLSGDKRFIHNNLLPLELLTRPLSFCDFRTLLNATQVNRTWHEASDSDKVWKGLCKGKFGKDCISENKNYCSQLGWKLAYFTGVCKTLLVNTPRGNAVALVPYPGLTIRDVLAVIGIEKPHQYRVSSSHFCERLSSECDEVEADGVEGCWTSLLAVKLCDVLVEPCSHLYVESIRRSDKKPRRTTGGNDDDDDPTAKVAKEYESKQVEEQAKLLWKTKALCKLERLPRFIRRGMQAHWPSLLTKSAGGGGGCARYSAAPATAVAEPIVERPRTTTTVTRVSGAGRSGQPPPTYAGETQYSQNGYSQRPGYSQHSAPSTTSYAAGAYPSQGYTSSAAAPVYSATPHSASSASYQSTTTYTAPSGNTPGSGDYRTGAYATSSYPPQPAAQYPQGGYSSGQYPQSVHSSYQASTGRGQGYYSQTSAASCSSYQPTASSTSSYLPSTQHPAPYYY